MERIKFLLLLIVLIPAISFADITKKIIEKYPPLSSTLPGNPKTVVYTDSKGKEVARELCDETGTVVEKMGKIPDGIVKEYLENGTLWVDYNYKNGKLEGTSMGYFQNGILRGKWNYKNGVLDGIVKEYYENGNVRSQVHYKNNNRHGTVEVFLEDGKPMFTWEYKDGKREGINRTYYENGKVHYELHYKDDKRNGIAKEYYVNGKVKAEYNYKDGEQDGISKTYYENETLHLIETYENGTLINKIEYDDKGNPISGRDHSAEEPRTGVEEMVKKTYQAAPKEESENADLKIVAGLGHAIGIDLTNSVPARGVQFTLEGVKITEVRTTSRTPGFLAKFNEVSGKVIIISTAGDEIAPGTGLIAEIVCDKGGSASLKEIIIANN